MSVHSRPQSVLNAAIAEHKRDDTASRDCRAAGWPRNSNAVDKAIMASRDVIAAAEPLAQKLLCDWTIEDAQNPYLETELGMWIAIAMCNQYAADLQNSSTRAQCEVSRIGGFRELTDIEVRIATELNKHSRLISRTFCLSMHSGFDRPLDYSVPPLASFRDKKFEMLLLSGSWPSQAQRPGRFSSVCDSPLYRFFCRLWKGLTGRPAPFILIVDMLPPLAVWKCLEKSLCAQTCPCLCRR